MVAKSVTVLEDAFKIFVFGLVFTLALLFTTTSSSMVIAPLITSIVLSVMYLFFESCLLFRIRRAKRCGKDCGGLCKNLELDNEQIYNLSRNNLVGEFARIRNEMKNQVKDLCCANLNDHFRHYQELSGVLTRVKRQIDNAGDQGDALRRDIAESTDFKDLRNYFDELTSSICAIRASIAKKEVESRNLRVQWWIGVGLAIGALVFLALS